MSLRERRPTFADLRSRYIAVMNSRKFGEFVRRPTNLLGLGIVALLAFCAIFAEPIVIRFTIEDYAISQTIQPFSLTPYDPNEQNIQNRLQSPSGEHLMGTDRLGRDMFSRVLYGARISLQVSATVVAITLVIGVVIGVVAGYTGGWVDEVLMRLVDLLFAFPGLLFALVVAAVLGPSLMNLMIALAAVGWTGYARIIRGEVLSVKEDDFIKAAQGMGASRSRILGGHIVPNVISPIVVLATMRMATIVLATAGLSFLGLGAQPPTPEWGTMLAQNRDLIGSAWWVVNFPGLAIMLTVFGFNLLGDGLRDVLDPRDVSGGRGGGL